MKIVECVPNFSEGRNMAVIDAITKAISDVEGVRLLDVDPGADTNRTVVTFIGSPRAVEEGAFAGIRKASELIDMTTHHGAHARMGATDVCPFIPVSEVTMEECVEISRRLGKRVGEELGIPVYLYEHSATTPQRQNLADIRKGEYEALQEKLHDPDFAPDFGKPVFNPKSGATVTGAREFLIAYNINLNTTDKKLAKDIALTIREKGRWQRDDKGKILRDDKGEKVRQPGMFRECKATGWYIDEYKQAQITMNLTNYKISPVHQVFDACCNLAHEMGLRVTGSELVGLIPRDALLAAGRHYLEKQGKCRGVSDGDLIRTAIQSLGLEDISPFDPDKKIIESFVENDPGALVNMTLRDFCDELSSDSPAPGGGSVAALCGALSASLSAMVANLTYDKKGYREYNQEMEEIAMKGQDLKKRFNEAIDRDTQAFNQLMAAMKSSAKTDQEKARKEQIILEASREATLVPLSVLEMIPQALEIAHASALRGNRNSISDAGVASLTAWAAARGAWYNVMINLQGINHRDFCREISQRADEVLNICREASDSVDRLVADALKPAEAGV